MYRFLLIIYGTLLITHAQSQEIEHHPSIYHTFIENKGQWQPNVLFKNKIELGNMWIEQGRILFQLQDYSKVEQSHFEMQKIKGDLTFRQQLVELKFVGAQKVKQIYKKGKSNVYFNYFIGNDPSKWASNVHGYEDFTLKNLYKGIDLHFLENEKQIKYEFIVQPKSDAQSIKLKYSFPKALKLDRNGNLIIETALGKIMEKHPKAYQIINGKIIDVSCKFILNNNEVTFQLGKYDQSVQLVIDPTLVFATYNGALSDNFGMTATYGYDGTAYCGGIVYGNQYPMPDSNVFDPYSNMTIPNVNIATTDAFITKYSPDGTNMLWSTFFGGGDNTQGTEVPHSLICDKNNNIYVYGTTSSTDFPIVNGFQTAFAGGTPLSITWNGVNFGTTGTDIYVAKFSSNGHQLLGSTYVGGSENDGVNYIISAGNYSSLSAYDSLTSNYGDQFRGEIMLDKNNNILVGSCSHSANFPTQNPFQSSIGGLEDGVIFEVKNDFSGLLFSSFFGGTKEDAIYSCKIDSSDNIVFAGGTTSSDLDTTSGCYQANYAGGSADGFIGKLTPNGQTLSYVTYVGTPNYDQIFFIDIDRLDNIFTLGQSNGGAFPVINSAFSNPGSSQFIAKFHPDLSGIESSTVFGSGSPTFDISPSAFLVDICGNMYVSGWGGSVLPGGSLLNGMPVSPDAFQSTPPDGHDFYLMVIEHGFNSLLYGTYMGGPLSEGHVDGGTSRFDKNGVVYQCVCGGCGGHSDFPTTPGAWSSQNNSPNCNAIVFKFDFNLIPNANFTANQTIGCAPFEVHFSNFSSQSDSYMWHFGNGELDSTTFEPIKTYSVPGTYDVMLTVTDSVCLLTDTALLSITVYPTLQLIALTPFQLCETHPITLTANSNGTATSFIWSSNSNFSDTLNNSLNDSTALVTNPLNGYYYVKIANNGCSKIDSVKVEYVGASLNIEGNNKLCVGDQSTITATSNNPSIAFSNFDWSSDGIINSGDGTNTVVVQPDSTQFLYVTATANNGCVVHDSILIAVSDIPSSSISASASEDKVPIGGEVTLTAHPDGYSYLWVPASDIENPSAQETKAKVNATTTYIVSISDGICTKTATVKVEAYPYICDNPYIFVPNAFSPNGDGNNDKLYVRSHVVQDIIFRVYNRWGQKVYETNRTNVGWDGKYKGKLMDPDVYDYYMEGHCIDGQHFLIKGNISLIR